MPRLDLTDAQMRQLLAELRPLLKPPLMAKVQSLVNELQALRERESVTRYLAGIEGAV
jgi:hypothetical protein